MSFLSQAQRTWIEGAAVLVAALALVWALINRLFGLGTVLTSSVLLGAIALLLLAVYLCADESRLRGRQASVR